jgi:hypothetical protein
MVCGTPVVTSDRAALAELVGDPAMVVDPDLRRRREIVVLYKSWRPRGTETYPADGLSSTS